MVPKTDAKPRLKTRRDFWLCFLLVLGVAIIYSKLNGYDFINLDDPMYVNANPYIGEGLTYNGISWSLKTSAPYAPYWHPITWMSHMLDVTLYGLKPGQHHLTNLLFHILNTIMLLVVLKEMTGNLWQSAFAAALFAFHPINVESVAWIAERKNVLSTFFWMLTLLSYAQYVKRPGAIRYGGVVLFHIMGLMSKPMVVTMPFVLLLLDFWPLNRFDSKGSPKASSMLSIRKFLHLSMEKFPLFLLSGISCIITYINSKAFGAVAEWGGYPFVDRVINSIMSYAGYLIKLFWPFRLTVFYPYSGGYPVWKITGAFVLLIVITGISFYLLHNKRYFIVGWLWYLGTLVPVIGFIQTGIQAMADRFAYVPLIGIFIIVAWGGAELFDSRRYKGLAGSVGAVFLIALASITRLQIGHWANSQTLFEQNLKVTSGNYLGHVCLGNALLEEGKTSKAINHYKTALKIVSNDRGASDRAGVALAKIDHTAETANFFFKSKGTHPVSNAYINLAFLLRNQGDFEEAFYYFTEALRTARTKQDMISAHINIGAYLAERELTADAMHHFKSALRYEPGNPVALKNLDMLRTGQNMGTESVEVLKRSFESGFDEN
jgi:Tfp pilus assembly protein PilF